MGARSYDQLAKDHKNTQAGMVYQYLANPGGGYRGDAFYGSGDMGHYSKLLRMGHVQLITWGLSGKQACLDALHEVQKKLPSNGKYPVLFSGAELDKMKKEADSVSRQLSKSCRELEQQFREYDRWPGSKEDPNYGEKKRANQNLIKELQQRSRSFDQEADKLFRGATPHDPSKRWDRY